MISFAKSVGLLASLLSFHLIPAHTANLCNGHAELCSRKFSNVTFVGTHDSPFVGDSPSDNQNVAVADQLKAGIRFLSAQTHLDPFKALSLCHTSCFLEDAGSLTSYLTTIKSFLDGNPSEVVTLLLTNGDNVDPKTFASSFSSAGLDKYAYTPASSPLAIDKWPTLGDLIAANTRLVAFLDYGAQSTVPYLLDEFSYFFETPYDTTDPNFPQCKIDRPPNANPDGRMYIVNHFLDVKLFGDVLVPDRNDAAKTNAATGAGSIGAQVGLCQGLYGRNPIGILVDFFDKGNVFKAQDTLNGF